jgi:hypothetical protein
MDRDDSCGARSLVSGYVSSTRRRRRWERWHQVSPPSSLVDCAREQGYAPEREYGT